MNAKADTRSISMEYELQHAPAKVWRALTEPKLLAAWLMTNDIQPTVGHRFTFRSEPTQWWDGIVQSEILEVEPHKKIAYAWRAGPESSRLDTVVTFTLTPTKSGGTRLTLEQTGFPAANRFAFDGANEGWRRMLGERLPEVLAQES